MKLDGKKLWSPRAHHVLEIKLGGKHQCWAVGPQIKEQVGYGAIEKGKKSPQVRCGRAELGR